MSICNDPVKFPSHYVIMDGKFEVRHLVEDRLRSLKHSTYKPNNPIVYSNYANVLKYACRWHLKGGIQDLKKMVEYAEMIIDQYEHEEAMDILEDEMDRYKEEEIYKLRDKMYKAKEKVTISDLAKAFEEDTNFDKVSAEYYDTLYGYRAERGPF